MFPVQFFVPRFDKTVLVIFETSYLLVYPELLQLCLVLAVSARCACTMMYFSVRAKSTYTDCCDDYDNDTFFYRLFAFFVVLINGDALYPIQRHVLS